MIKNKKPELTGSITTNKCDENGNTEFILKMNEVSYILNYHFNFFIIGKRLRKVWKPGGNNDWGQTDKKLTSTLVIWTFLSFELADIFLKYGSRLFFKKSKKLRFPSSLPTTTKTQPPRPGAT